MNEGKKDRIEDVLPELNRFKNISIVVNNAASDTFDNYNALEPQAIVDLITVNCFALAAICYKFIPYFDARIN
jgi:short-subunit dehydrogenase